MGQQLAVLVFHDDKKGDFIDDSRDITKAYDTFKHSEKQATWNEHAPEWTKDIDSMGGNKPQWMNPVVNDLANKMMTHINPLFTQIAAASAVTLGRDS